MSRAIKFPPPHRDMDICAPGKNLLTDWADVASTRFCRGKSCKMTETYREPPPHIDLNRVIDFDFYSDHRYAKTGDIHRAMFRMAEEEGRGIFWTPRNGGHWCINDHAMLFDAVRDTQLFSSSALTLPPMPEGEEPRVLPISLDGEEHTAYRLPLLKAFAPASIKAMEPAVRAFAITLIESVRGIGRCNFVDTISEPLPVIIFMRFMGLDTTRLREFRLWVYDMLSSDDARRAGSHHKIQGMLAEVLAQRRVAPRDDLISRLLVGQVRGRPLEEDELLAFCLLLFAAGLDTVANALSFGMNHLARDPALQDRLRADPKLIPAAVEELLRLYGVANVVRVVKRDTEWHGANLKAGERVLMMLTVGNYDGAVYRDPAAFDLDREGEPHISFNVGPHRCVGSHLARLELNVFYTEWFKRMPNVWVDPEISPSLRGGQTLALGALPLLWSQKPMS
jgi:cytochrome P450